MAYKKSLFSQCFFFGLEKSLKTILKIVFVTLFTIHKMGLCMYSNYTVCLVLRHA